MEWARLIFSQNMQKDLKGKHLIVFAIKQGFCFKWLWNFGQKSVYFWNVDFKSWRSRRGGEFYGSSVDINSVHRGRFRNEVVQRNFFSWQVSRVVFLIYKFNHIRNLTTSFKRIIYATIMFDNFLWLFGKLITEGRL